jgi:alpha-galactosidase
MECSGPGCGRSGEKRCLRGLGESPHHKMECAGCAESGERRLACERQPFFKATFLFALLISVGDATSSPRGANTWYSWLGPSNESATVLAASYMRDNLLRFGYSSYTLDEGWAESNGNLLLDANGLPVWNPALYPSGLPALAADLKSMGLQLGVWLMRGIPREAVERKLPIAGTPYTCDQAVRYDRNCSWNSHTYGSNGSPAADAYYAALAAKVEGWGVSFVKFDCLWPHLYEGSPQTYFNEDVVGVAKAIKPTGLTLSMSPGISVSPQNATLIAQGTLATMYRIAEDVLDVYNSSPDGTFPQGVHQKFAKALEYEHYLGSNGTWPDFDMLQVGEVVKGYGRSFLPPSETRLTPAEQQAEFSLFCFTGVPLIIGGLLPLASSSNGTRTLSLLTQAELLTVHNSSSARKSFKPTPSPLYPGAELYGWANTPVGASGARFVGVFSAGNASLGQVEAAVRFSEDAGLQGLSSACVRDMVTGEWEEPVGGDVGQGQVGLFTSIDPHGSRSLLITEVGSEVCRAGLK